MRKDSLPGTVSDLCDSFTHYSSSGKQCPAWQTSKEKRLWWSQNLSQGRELPLSKWSLAQSNACCTRNVALSFSRVHRELLISAASRSLTLSACINYSANSHKVCTSAYQTETLWHLLRVWDLLWLSHFPFSLCHSPLNPNNPQCPSSHFSSSRVSHFACSAMYL